MQTLFPKWGCRYLLKFSSLDGHTHHQACLPSFLVALMLHVSVLLLQCHAHGPSHDLYCNSIIRTKFLRKPAVTILQWNAFLRLKICEYIPRDNFGRLAFKAKVFFSFMFQTSKNFKVYVPFMILKLLFSPLQGIL